MNEAALFAVVDSSVSVVAAAVLTYDARAAGSPGAVAENVTRHGAARQRAERAGDDLAGDRAAPRTAGGDGDGAGVDHEARRHGVDELRVGRRVRLLFVTGDVVRLGAGLGTLASGSDGDVGELEVTGERDGVAVRVGVVLRASSACWSWSTFGRPKVVRDRDRVDDRLALGGAPA